MARPNCSTPELISIAFTARVKKLAYKLFLLAAYGDEISPQGTNHIYKSLCTYLTVNKVLKLTYTQAAVTMSSKNENMAGMQHRYKAIEKQFLVINLTKSAIQKNL